MPHPGCLEDDHHHSGLHLVSCFDLGFDPGLDPDDDPGCDPASGLVPAFRQPVSTRSSSYLWGLGAVQIACLIGLP